MCIKTPMRYVFSHVCVHAEAGVAAGWCAGCSHERPCRAPHPCSHSLINTLCTQLASRCPGLFPRPVIRRRGMRSLRHIMARPRRTTPWRRSSTNNRIRRLRSALLRHVNMRVWEHSRFSRRLFQSHGSLASTRGDASSFSCGH